MPAATVTDALEAVAAHDVSRAAAWLEVLTPAQRAALGPEAQTPLFLESGRLPAHLRSLLLVSLGLTGGAPEAGEAVDAATPDAPSVAAMLQAPTTLRPVHALTPGVSAWLDAVVTALATDVALVGPVVCTYLDRCHPVIGAALGCRIIDDPTPLAATLLRAGPAGKPSSGRWRDGRRPSRPTTPTWRP